MLANQQNSHDDPFIESITLEKTLLERGAPPRSVTKISLLPNMTRWFITDHSCCKEIVFWRTQSGYFSLGILFASAVYSFGKNTDSPTPLTMILIGLMTHSQYYCQYIVVLSDMMIRQDPRPSMITLLNRISGF
jgi:hypothetical protein